MFTTGTREQPQKLSRSLVNSSPVVNRFVRLGPQSHFELSPGTRSSFKTASPDCEDRTCADTGKVPLVHEGEEGGIVLTGRLEVTVDDERRILGPGDAYYFESRRPHRFRCVGPYPCEVISACTPPSF